MQEILQEPQVKVSKHLGYLKQHELVDCERRANWCIYRISTKPNPLLTENLRCLQDLLTEEPVFRSDLKRLLKTDTSAACEPTSKSTNCCA